MSDKARQPRVGDYWCMGLLTGDFLEAVSHAAKFSRKNNEEVVVQRYVKLDADYPLMAEAAIIRKPAPK